MNWRWQVGAYGVMRPMIGHWLAMKLSGLLPVILFAGVPLMLYWLLLSTAPHERGVAADEQCGTGAMRRDC